MKKMSEPSYRKGERVPEDIIAPRFGVQAVFGCDVVVDHDAKRIQPFDEMGKGEFVILLSGLSGVPLHRVRLEENGFVFLDEPVKKPLEERPL